MMKACQTHSDGLYMPAVYITRTRKGYHCGANWCPNRIRSESVFLSRQSSSRVKPRVRLIFLREQGVLTMDWLGQRSRIQSLLRMWSCTAVSLNRIRHGRSWRRKRKTIRRRWKRSLRIRRRLSFRPLHRKNLPRVPPK